MQCGGENIMCWLAGSFLPKLIYVYYIKASTKLNSCISHIIIKGSNDNDKQTTKRCVISTLEI